MKIRSLLCVALLAAPLVAAETSRAEIIDGLRIAPVDRPPLSDAAAARLVRRTAWEPRPANAADNHRVPTAAELAAFRAQNTADPYKQYVDGQYRGTTDEIIQWAAAKWGLDPNLLRAVAAVETWWDMSFVGNDGSAFGLFQVREPYHCVGPVVCGLFRHDTAFNADYYASIIRSYFDGRQTWLNTVSGNGAPYQAGELWNSVGYWASGRWQDAQAAWYVSEVQYDLAHRVWAQPYFVGK